jgi:hypothetical protein
MAESRVGDEDPDMLAMIAAAFDALDPVPERFVSEDFSYVRWAAPDADIGVLFALVGSEAVRHADTSSDVQAYKFEQAAITVIIDLDSMTGEVRPWLGGSAWIETTQGVHEVEIDESGEFVLTGVGAGSVRLWVRTPDGDAVTGWFHVIRGRSS